MVNENTELEPEILENCLQHSRRCVLWGFLNKFNLKYGPVISWASHILEVKIEMSLSWDSECLCLRELSSEVRSKEVTLKILF